MVLGELPTGQFEWGLSFHSRGSIMGQLVTDSRFFTASPYSYQVRSTGPEGSLPFFEQKPWTMCDQDSNMGQDALGARAPWYWPLADPSFSTPRSKGAPEQLSNQSVGQPSNSRVLMGRRSIFSLLTPGS
jgi:hypothetical protein